MKTFRTRVTEFWEWFPTIAEQTHRELSEGNVEGVLATFPNMMQELLPGLSWVFGPGKNGGHSFTVTGEGQKGKQMLAADWLKHEVDLPGWTFHASRQPSPRTSNENAAIDVGGNAMALSEVKVAMQVDEERERVDITAWHPRFDEIDENGRWQILFLFLDEVLGEYGTQMWIGEIEFAEETDAIDLIDLPPHLNRLQDKYEWEKHSPLDEYTGYAAENPEPGLPRRDVIAGYTLFPQLVFEFANEGPVEADPVEGTGAEFVYLAINASLLPEDDPLGGRDEIENTLAGELGDSAIFWGGATGIESSYLDLLLLDGDRTREKLDTALKAMGIQSECQLFSFTK